MKTMEELRHFFEGDRFAMEKGIRIDSVSADTAVCSIELSERHSNALGSAQGGLIFTLADFAFAVAANSGDAAAVTLNSSIDYLRPPRGKSLIATATAYGGGRAICRYQVDVTDELGTHVARVTATGYRK